MQLHQEEMRKWPRKLRSRSWIWSWLVMRGVRVSAVDSGGLSGRALPAGAAAGKAGKAGQGRAGRTGREGREGRALETGRSRQGAEGREGPGGEAAACQGGRCRRRCGGAMLAAAPALLACVLLLLPLSLPTRSIIAINAGGETILAPDGQVFEEDR